VRVNANRGSEHYQATNSVIAWSYLRCHLGRSGCSGRRLGLLTVWQHQDLLGGFFAPDFGLDLGIATASYPSPASFTDIVPSGPAQRAESPVGMAAGIGVDRERILPTPKERQAVGPFTQASHGDHVPTRFQRLDQWHPDVGAKRHSERRSPRRRAKFDDPSPYTAGRNGLGQARTDHATGFSKREPVDANGVATFHPIA
jgi:hypothetical protein